MKKVLALGIMATMITGCGTIMESSRKTVTITTDTVSNAYLEDGTYLGQGRTFNTQMDNRSGRKNDIIILKEVGNEDNQYLLRMDREINRWGFWNFAIDFGIISYPIDLISGSHKRLARTHYSVPDFAKLKTDNTSSSQLETEFREFQLKEKIKQELEVERTKERVLLLEANS